MNTSFPFSSSIRLFSALFLLVAAPLFSLPWGKDADLAKPLCEKNSTSSANSMGETLIRFHQKVLSQADGPRSHFYPSSSEYMRQAIRYHGFLNGFFMGCDRLIRENDEAWIYRTYRTRDRDILKYDPVPKFAMDRAIRTRETFVQHGHSVLPNQDASSISLKYFLM
jgi:putative component of membrane protein insertase Oxa1/YidC/SpoIIIJ protein YidD